MPTALSSWQKIFDNEIQEALLKGQTIERKRVANELHDNVGSLLSAVRVSLLTFNSANANGVNANTIIDNANAAVSTLNNFAAKLCVAVEET